MRTATPTIKPVRTAFKRAIPYIVGAVASGASNLGLKLAGVNQGFAALTAYTIGCTLGAAQNLYTYRKSTPKAQRTIADQASWAASGALKAGSASLLTVGLMSAFHVGTIHNEVVNSVSVPDNSASPNGTTSTPSPTTYTPRADQAAFGDKFGHVTDAQHEIMLAAHAKYPCDDKAATDAVHEFMDASYNLLDNRDISEEQLAIGLANKAHELGFATPQECYEMAPNYDWSQLTCG